MLTAKTPVQPPVATQTLRVQRLRDLIAEALAGGAAAEDLVLRLTTRDASALKRHPSVAMHEVAFAGGEMRFLAVKVEEGAVAAPEITRRA